MTQQATVIHGVEPSSAAMDTIEPAKEKSTVDHDDVESLKHMAVSVDLGEEGAQRIELMQQSWGKHGKKWIFVALAFCMIVYELDETTYATYFNYALSDFRKTSSTSALGVATNLTFSLTKPIWARSSDIFGRGEIYPAALAFILVGLSVAASASSFSAFAAGTVLRVVGLTALNSLNTIVVADLTTTRQRGFGVNFQFFPYMVLPWVSSYIVDKVLSPGGIGWRWGIGILAIVFPLGIVTITSVLLTFQRRAKKLETGAVKKPKITLLGVCSNIDLGGLSILIVSLAFILLPLSLAALEPTGFRTPWVIALIVIGSVGLLTAFPFYEGRIAAHPFLPLRYLRHRAIGLAFLLYFTDYMAAGASHGYLYNWALIAQGFNIMQATNLSYVNAVLTFVTGTLFGLVMWKTRTYKWWIMAGCVVRIVGYGVMFRIRNANPNIAELFIIQVVQGVGDGIVQTGGYVAATVNVPHRETAQMTALIVMVGMLGSAVGDAISGAIYTGTFRQELAKQLGAQGTPELVEALFNSIDVLIPEWGTPDRVAINTAYNHVTSYFFIAAMVIIAPGFLIVYFLPNQKLNDSQNLIEDHGMFGDNQPIVESTEPLGETESKGLSDK
ncbi:major facilitator superfamily domain-containing protein [Pseudomassariella vexata]|uniref:Major facilitator superfamily domain-containing protein n=1 Tax=Pseudomassariella vexata TaxID=1141098 RepID=A0A1Y2EFG1_9PEZI|nr:major facilitator superfamily domain-containing protein [Pseudomassariella vexata]ORY70312.1 major facilitator superfamily domain-containing protein [Pseudomassariella vexata]